MEIHICKMTLASQLKDKSSTCSVIYSEVFLLMCITCEGVYRSLMYVIPLVLLDKIKRSSVKTSVTCSFITADTHCSLDLVPQHADLFLH